MLAFPINVEKRGYHNAYVIRCNKIIIEIDEYAYKYLINSIIPGVNSKTKIIAISANLDKTFKKYWSSLHKNRKNILLESLGDISPKLDKIVNTRNLGGDSVVSEVLSALISLVFFDKFNVQEIIPEIEIEYEHNCMPKGDHLFRLLKVMRTWFLVSTTRVYNNVCGNTISTTSNLCYFLYRKLCGLCSARDNLNKENYQECHNVHLIMHVFCKNKETAKKVRDCITAIRRGKFGYTSHNLYEINIMVIISDINEIFHSHNEGFEHVDNNTISHGLNRFGFALSKNNELYKQKFKSGIDLSVEAISFTLLEATKLYRDHCIGRKLSNGDHVYSVQSKNLYPLNTQYARSLNVLAQIYSNVSKVMDDVHMKTEQKTRFGLITTLTKLSNETTTNVINTSDILFNKLMNL